MGLGRALFLLVTGYVINCATAAAEDLCPAGPYETDVRKIAAAIASDPLSPWFGSIGSGRFTDGAVWTSSGGLRSTSTTSLSYDAKRYLVEYVVRSWPDPDFKPARPEPAKPFPGQTIRKVGIETYTTTIAQPTPDQAREFACLANRLLAPLETESPEGSAPPSSAQALPEIAVTARRICHGEWFSDGYEEGFELLRGGSEVSNTSVIPCATRLQIKNQLAGIAYEPINEVLERGKGTWRPPHLHSVAVDAADNLYLLIDPGTHRPRNIEVRKITPSGEVTRLLAHGADRFYGATLTIDGRGHPQVTLADWSGRQGGVVIYDLAPGVDPDSSERNRRLVASDLTRSDQRIYSIAADSINNLYAMSRSEILEITPAGVMTLIAKYDIGYHPKATSYPDRPFHIAVAWDNTIFVSDAAHDIILKVTLDGAVTILAGTANKTGTTDGPGSKALFNSPAGLTFDRTGTLYVADSANETIRRITPDGRVSTLAGRPGKHGTVDGQGRSARFDAPDSIAIDGAGTLYVTNGADNRIRKVSSTGVVSTLNAQPFIDAQ